MCWQEIMREVSILRFMVNLYKQIVMNQISQIFLSSDSIAMEQSDLQNSKSILSL